MKLLLGLLFAATLQSATLVRIQCGGTGGSDPQGNVWKADAYFTGGARWSSANQPNMAALPVPYNTLRYSANPPGAPFSYSIPANPGNYTVTLKFLEPNKTAIGQRVFNVAGATVNQQALDLFAVAPGALVPYDLSFPIIVAPGMSAIQISLTAATGNAVLSGIQVDDDTVQAKPVSYVTGLESASPVCPPAGLTFFYATDTDHLFRCYAGGEWKVVGDVRNATPAIAQDTIIPWINPGAVYQGFPLMMTAQVIFAFTPNHVYYTALTSSDAGDTITPYCNFANQNCWGSSPKYYYNAGGGAVNSLFIGITLTPASNGNTGPRTITLTVTTNSVQLAPLTFTVNVLAVPSVPTAPTITRAPLLPSAAKAAYEAYMLDVASPNDSTARCDPANPRLSTYWIFSIESQAWYYDGAKVYAQIADYTGNPAWKLCALSIADGYAVWAVGAGNQGYQVFSQGLRWAYEYTGDVKYKNAITGLLTTKAYSASGGDPSDGYIRETAYMLRAYTDAHLVGLSPDSAAVARSLNYLLGDFNTLFSAAPGSSPLVMYNQSFFDGIGAEALTYYYDNWVKDPRIPPAIKSMVDWTWTYMWHDPGNRLCAVTGETACLWNNPYVASATYPHFCDAACQQAYGPTVFNLVTPAYWWYWRLTGDDSYRVKGDMLFQHAVDSEPWSGKEFSQFYHWSLMGMVQRNLPDVAPAAKLQECSGSGPGWNCAGLLWATIPMQDGSLVQLMGAAMSDYQPGPGTTWVTRK